jgi:GntR family transcriptional regulator
MENKPVTAISRRFNHGPAPADTPLYKHVKDQIIEALRTGEWRPGDILPSESRLAERYDVGISTIRAAVSELAAAGVLVRRQGKGTFVAIHGDQQNLFRFFHVVRNDGTRILPVSNLLSFSKATADEETAEMLALPRAKQKAGVYRISNMLKVDGTPVIVSEMVVPVEMFPGLTKAMLAEGSTLYAVYQRHFGVTITRTSERLASAGADAFAVEHLDLPLGAPVLELRRVAYTFGDRPVEVRHSRIDTRHYHYRLEEGDQV